MSPYKKTGMIFFIPALCAAFLSAQSLVEVAQKERERREKLKGKNARVVTNIDLKAMNRTLGVLSGPTEVQSAESRESRRSEGTFTRQTLRSPEAITSRFATDVLPDTNLVTNPQFALGSPDGRFAEISILGSLELEFSANNGQGDDIAVYSKRTAEGIQPEAMSYGLLVMGDRGEWEEIGRGGGMTSPERFELGRISSIKKIKIVFRYNLQPDLGEKSLRLHSEEYTMGIDAVQAQQ